MSTLSNRADIDTFLERLVAEQYAEQNAFGRIKSAISQSGQPCDVVITELGILNEEELLESFSSLLDLETVDVSNNELKEIDTNEFQIEFLLKKSIIATQISDEFVDLIVSDPFDQELFNAIEFRLGRSVRLSIASRRAIQSHLKKAFENLSSAQVSTANIITDNSGAKLTELDVERLNAIANDAPTVRLVQELLTKALNENASDIHIEPAEQSLAIRFRIDGTLIKRDLLSKQNHQPILTRIKILGNLNIAEQRLPQDGQMRVVIEGNEVDFRISVLPTVYGQAVVVRILDQSNVKLDFKELGYEPEDRSEIQKLFNHSNGIVLVSGPTNSGKSTTLYTALSILRDYHGKLVTVEDPVEMNIQGVSQTQINHEIDLSFPSALRAILRHDPDVIMVGEIRDEETARIAIQAALTGHLVISTIHTNTAIGAITRLRDMGIEDYLISATLRGVVSQRLVRKLCKDCSIASEKQTNENTQCKTCSSIGYKGRTCIYEYFSCDEQTAELISTGDSQEVISKYLSSQKMTTLEACAKSKINQGVTSKNEVLKVIGQF